MEPEKPKRKGFFSIPVPGSKKDKSPRCRKKHREKSKEKELFQAHVDLRDEGTFEFSYIDENTEDQGDHKKLSDKGSSQCDQLSSPPHHQMAQSNGGDFPKQQSFATVESQLPRTEENRSKNEENHAQSNLPMREQSSCNAHHEENHAKTHLSMTDQSSCNDHHEENHTKTHLSMTEQNSYNGPHAQLHLPMSEQNACYINAYPEKMDTEETSNPNMETQVYHDQSYDPSRYQANFRAQPYISRIDRAMPPAQLSTHDQNMNSHQSCKPMMDAQSNCIPIYPHNPHFSYDQTAYSPQTHPIWRDHACPSVQQGMYRPTYPGFSNQVMLNVASYPYDREMVTPTAPPEETDIEISSFGSECTFATAADETTNPSGLMAENLREQLFHLIDTSTNSPEDIAQFREKYEKVMVEMIPLPRSEAMPAMEAFKSRLLLKLTCNIDTAVYWALIAIELWSKDLLFREACHYEDLVALLTFLAPPLNDEKSKFITSKAKEIIDAGKASYKLTLKDNFKTLLQVYLTRDLDLAVRLIPFLSMLHSRVSKQKMPLKASPCSEMFEEYLAHLTPQLEAYAISRETKKEIDYFVDMLIKNAIEMENLADINMYKCLALFSDFLPENYERFFLERILTALADICADFPRCYQGFVELQRTISQVRRHDSRILDSFKKIVKKAKVEDVCQCYFEMESNDGDNEIQGYLRESAETIINSNSYFARKDQNHRKSFWKYFQRSFKPIEKSPFANRAWFALHGAPCKILWKNEDFLEHFEDKNEIKNLKSALKNKVDKFFKNDLPLIEVRQLFCDGFELGSQRLLQSETYLTLDEKVHDYRRKEEQLRGMQYLATESSNMLTKRYLTENEIIEDLPSPQSYTELMDSIIVMEHLKKYLELAEQSAFSDLEKRYMETYQMQAREMHSISLRYFATQIVKPLVEKYELLIEFRRSLKDNSSDFDKAYHIFKTEPSKRLWQQKSCQDSTFIDYLKKREEITDCKIAIQKECEKLFSGEMSPNHADILFQEDDHYKIVISLLFDKKKAEDIQERFEVYNMIKRQLTERQNLLSSFKQVLHNMYGANLALPPWDTIPFLDFSLLNIVRYLELLDDVKQFLNLQYSSIFSFIKEQSFLDKKTILEAHSKEDYSPVQYVEHCINDYVRPLLSDYMKLSSKISAILDQELSIQEIIAICKQFGKGLKIFLKEMKPKRKIDPSSVTLADKILLIIEKLGLLKMYISTISKIIEIMELKNVKRRIGLLNEMIGLLEAEDDLSEKNIQERTVNIAFQMLELFEGHDLSPLTAFEECHDLVKWVRQRIRKRGDFQVFKELCSIHVGISEDEITSLTAVDSAVTAYDHLLFEVKESSTLEDILKACKDATNFCRKDPAVLDNIKASSRICGRLKLLEDQLGSIESASLKTLEAIDNSGVYKVRLADGFHLEFNQVGSDQNTSSKSKQIYSLSDLEELHSKLILIDKASKANVLAERFIMIYCYIKSLTDMSQRLLKNGCPFFKDTSLKIFCNPDKSVKLEFDFRKSMGLIQSEMPLEESLKELANLIQDCQKQWDQRVKDLRDQYPILNFYKNSQLFEMSTGISRYLNNNICLPGSLINLFKLSNEKVTKEQIFEEIERTIDCQDQSLSEQSYDRIVNKLERNYYYEKEVAKASIAANVENLGELTLKDLINWCFDFQDVDLSELARKYDSLANNGCTREDVEEVSSGSEGNMLDILKLEWQLMIEGKKSCQPNNFINLEDTGKLLQKLESNNVNFDRSFPATFRSGKPNFLILESKNLYSKVLDLYLQDGNAPFPGSDEILIIGSNTDHEDLDNILNRAFQDKTGRIYCIINADLLDFTLCQHLEHRVTETESRNFRLVLVGRKGQRGEHYFRSYFSKDVVFDAFIPRKHNQVELIYRHLQKKNCANSDGFMRLITSERPGNGKTLNSIRSSELLDLKLVSAPIHDKELNYETIINQWSNASPDQPCLYHVNICSPELQSIHEFLFQLFILNVIQGKNGQVWICDKISMYLIELSCDITSQEKVHEGKSFLSHLPRTVCLTPLESISCAQGQDNSTQEKLPPGQSQQSFDDTILASEIIQRPCKYLQAFKNDRDLETISLSPDTKLTSLECLQILTEYCPVENPTYAELMNFASFFNTNLQLAENSDFTALAKSELEWRGFKAFVIKFLLTLSEDFATPSLFISDESKRFEPTIKDRRSWESSSHPYVLFNADGHSLTFLGLKINSSNMNLEDLKTGKVLRPKIMTRNLYRALQQQNEQMKHEKNENSWIPLCGYNIDHLSPQKKLTLLCRILAVDPKLCRWDASFKLTQDNIQKMCALYLRILCNIPVCVMGETGCGKTRMIRCLCDLMKGNKDRENMILLKVHGGVDAEHIYATVERALRIADENSKNGSKYTVLFFDEANTTGNIGVIKEVMLDRICRGKRIPETTSLRFVAAINPYRRHTESYITQLKHAGLGYNVNIQDTPDKLGETPMRDLVYRVQALPQAFFPYVWDFGSVTQDNERDYIKEMLKSQLTDFAGSCLDQKSTGDVCLNHLTEIISKSQQILREHEECSYVSLRDVERFILVSNWFEKMQSHLLSHLADLKNIKMSKHLEVHHLLALGVAYLTRLNKGREHYREEMSDLTGCTPKDFLKLLNLCQSYFVDQLEVSANVSKNEALRENAFMMMVSIELKIPIFIIGKPGSSKSLAKTLVNHSLTNHTSEFLKTFFKQIQMVSFQCSHLATSKVIINTFRQCQLYQQKKDLEKFTAVLVLDEVGLAEDSANMPLKCLHPLLEDGCIDNETPEPYKKVSFIGISNWSLDPAKMNRALMVLRNVPTEEELEMLHVGLCNHDISHDLMSKLRKGYLQVYNNQDKEYFGLRDFYSMVKMVAAKIDVVNGCMPTMEELNLIIRRNFGGHFEDFSPLAEFVACGLINTRNIPEKDVIFSCLKDLVDPSVASRYLLCFTENMAALRILPNTIKQRKCTVIFGTSFPGDQNYQQICYYISRVKMAMDMGDIVVLYNLENIYESLYDALNQNYVYMGESRYVDIGIGTHRVKARVDLNFRLIIVAEKEDALNFPVPLLSRMEKHFIGMETFLSNVQTKLKGKIARWVEQFSKFKDPNLLSYSPLTTFIGYHEDLLPSLMIEESGNLTKKEQPECEVTSDKDNNDLFLSCKERLLRNVTPDGIIRLEETVLTNEMGNICQAYCNKSRSWENILKDMKSDTLSYVQVLTKSYLLSKKELDQIFHQHAGNDILAETAFLTQFQKEQEFRVFFENCSNTEDKKILFIQAEVNNSNDERLIQGTKYIIEDIISKSQKHNLGIVYIIRISGVAGTFYGGYSIDPWNHIYMDELRESCLLSNPVSLLEKTLHDILQQGLVISEEELDKLIKDALPSAGSRIKDESDPARKIERLALFMEAYDDSTFKAVLWKKILEILKKKESNLHCLAMNSDNGFVEFNKDGFCPENWLRTLAIYSSNLREGMSFHNAMWKHIKNILSICLGHIISKVDVQNNLDHYCIKSKDKESKFNDCDLNMKVEFLQLFSELDVVKDFSSMCQNPRLGVSSNSSLQIPFVWVLFEMINSLPNEQYRKQLRNNCPHTFYFLGIIETSQKLKEMIVQDFLKMRLRSECSEKCVKSITSRILAQFEDSSQRLSLFKLIHNFSTFKKELTTFLEIVSRYNFNYDSIDFGLGRLDLSALEILFDKEIVPSIKQSNIGKTHSNWRKDLSDLSPIINEVLGSLDTTACSRVNGIWQRLRIIDMYITQVASNDDIGPELKQFAMQKLNQVWDNLITSRNEGQGLHTILENLHKFLNHLSLNAPDLLIYRKQKKCAKCHEGIQDPVQLPCGHVTCESCIKEYFLERNQKRCPASRCSEPNFKDAFNPSSKEHIDEKTSLLERFQKRIVTFFISIIDKHNFEELEGPNLNVMKVLLELAASIKMLSKSKARSNLTSDYGLESSFMLRSYLLQLCLQVNLSESQELIQEILNSEVFQQIANKFQFLCYYIYSSKTIFSQIFPDDTSTENELFSKTDADAQAISRDSFDSVETLDTLNGIVRLRHFIAKLACELVDNNFSFDCSSYQENNKFTWTALSMFKNQEKAANQDLQMFLARVLCMHHRTDSISLLRCDKILCTLLPSSLQNASGVIQARYICMDKFEEVFEVFKSKKDSSQIVRHNMFYASLATFYITQAMGSKEIIDVKRLLEDAREKELFEGILEKRFAWLNWDTSEPVRKTEWQNLAAVMFMWKETRAGLPRGLGQLFYDIMTGNNVDSKFLPGIVNDSVYETVMAMRESDMDLALYQCPKGHYYFIGECRRPWIVSKCSCGEDIGGTLHNEARGNVRVNNLESVKDTTVTGYCLDACKLAKEKTASLEAWEINVLRLIINTSLLVSCEFNFYSTQSSLKTTMSKSKFEDFCRSNMDELIQSIAHEINITQDDVFNIAYKLLSLILNDEQELYKLSTKDDKRKWEENFKIYLREARCSYSCQRAEIQKRLKDHSYDQALDDVINQKTILYQVQKEMSCEDLADYVKTKPSGECFKTLEIVLEDLEVTQALSDIPLLISFYKDIHNQFRQKLSLTTLKDVTVEQFTIDHQINEDSVQAIFRVWNKLRKRICNKNNHLRRYAGQELDDWSPRTVPATFLLPSSQGLGRIPQAILEELTTLHNRLIVEKDFVLPVSNMKKGHAIDIDSASITRLIWATRNVTFDGDYLEMDNQYDLEGIDELLRCKFLKWKPRLSRVELEKVEFLEDKLPKLAKLSFKQEKLSKGQKISLSESLNDVPEVSTLLEDVLIAREYLFKLEQPDLPQKKLLNFMEKDLLMENDHRRKKSISGITIGQIDDVIAHLKILRVETMIRFNINPFEMVIAKSYLADLPASITIDKEVLRNLLPLLPHLHDFINERLRTQPDEESQSMPFWSLKDTLESGHLDLLDEEEVDTIMKGTLYRCLQHVPEELQLQHAPSFLVALIKQKLQKQFSVPKYSFNFSP